MPDEIRKLEAKRKRLRDEHAAIYPQFEAMAIRLDEIAAGIEACNAEIAAHHILNREAANRPVKLEIV